MARVAFPFHENGVSGRPVGDMGKFIIFLALLLREQGEDVTLVLTREEPRSSTFDARLREDCDAGGIDVIEVGGEVSASRRWPDIWPMQLSEQLWPILRTFDILYFADCAELAIHTVRMKRFTTTAMPVCVTVLHRPISWALMTDRRHPGVPDHLNLDFVERYCAKHSDSTIATNRQMLARLRRDGWQFSGEPQVFGLPYRVGDIQTPGQGTPNLNRLAYLGPLQWDKGLDVFVSAIRELRKQSPEELGRVDEVVLLATGHEEGSGIPD